ncbi:MAG: GAF domain-containing protein [Chloroflexi bacterium]|nr:GAF domain-containing protein [Chloroflexota bacterium]
MTGQPPEDATPGEMRSSRTLYDLTTAAGRDLSQDPADLVRSVAEHASALLGGDGVAVYLWDPARDVLLPIYSNDPRQPAYDRPLHAGEGAAGRAVKLRQTIVVDDYAHFEQAVPWGVARGLKSVEAVPLMLDDRPIGALVIRFYGERRVTGADEARTLDLLAALAAPALEAARLYASSQLGREHERTLREITSALAENLDEHHVLELAVNRSAELLQAPYARVWLIEPDGELSCAAAEGYVHPDTFIRHLAHDSISGMAAREQIVNLGNAPAESHWYFNREFGDRTGLGAYLGAGLWRAGESLGVIEVMRQVGYRFSDAEEQLLVSLANAVAVAVSNARTHAAVERLAREAEQRAELVAESERVLRSVYEAIGSGVLVMNPEGLVVTANAAAEEIFGIPASRLIGKPPGLIDIQLVSDGSIVPVDEKPTPRVTRNRAAERKQIFSFVHPDHRRRWLQVDVVPLFGADGQVSRVVSSFIDITEQKSSEEALRRRDLILQAVAFAAENLLSSPEWEHSIDDVLRELGAATGVSRVYIVPRDARDSDLREATHHQWTADNIVPRADFPSRGSYLQSLGLTRWEQILRDGGIIQGDLRSFPSDEQQMLAAQGVCSLVLVPIFVGSGWWGFIGFDDCFEERTWPPSLVEALKTAAGTLGAAILRRRADAERLQLVREQSARVEAETAQRRLAYLAEASQILAGSLDFEPGLQGVANLLVPGLVDGCFFDMSQHDGSIRRVASAGLPELDARLSPPPVAAVIRGNQSWLSARALTVPLVTHAGVTGALTWLASNARPAFHAHDLDLAEHLARRCALAIDNSRLYREARAAVSIRDEFLSVAAHELKTPMTSLRGYAQLLGREFDRGEPVNQERARRAADTIQVQSDKLARLVAQLLDVSRLQSGKLTVERTSSDLAELMHEMVAAARSQLKHHTLVADLPNELWASIDPLRIEQVVSNLLDNAIKYSPEGGQIEVELTCLEPLRSARLVVRDHGVGVPPQHRDHIFDRFYQAHASSPLTSMAGMGLGLYITRQIVEMHDGSITAQFPDDGGTRFVVLLPLPTSSSATERGDGISATEGQRHREAHRPSG